MTYARKLNVIKKQIFDIRFQVKINLMLRYKDGNITTNDGTKVI